MRRPDLVRGGAVLTGGAARGAKLFTVPGRDIRPALARLRKSIFDVLSDRVTGATVLDLFAGIGTMGLEALSRGASFAIFVDSDPRCVEAVNQNLKRLRLLDKAIVIADDALSLQLKTPDRFDLVFVDPPYSIYDDPDSAARLEASVATLPIRGLILVEHRTVQKFGESWAGGRLVDRRKYGGTTVSLYSRV